MKTRFILHVNLVLAGLLFTNGIYAQDYRVLQPERTYQYSSYTDILSMHVDSIDTDGTVTTYYLIKNLQQMDWNCFHVLGPSWMGDRVAIQPDGSTFFYNVSDQPVLIKTQALLNEEWICYSRPDLSISASISSVGINDVLGIQDSIKMVSFQAKNADGQNISHEVNGMNLTLSKNYGLVKTLNFYDFPDSNFGTILLSLTELSLCGYTNPEVGVQNLSWKQVNDHNPGDELHTRATETGVGFSKYIETIALVLDKEISGDTIKYTWENKIKTSYFSPDSNTFTAIIDTIGVNITSDPNFDNLSGVSWTSDYWGDASTVNLMGQNELGLTKTDGSLHIYNKGTWTYLGDTCYTPMIICGCVSENVYYQGLSGPYYYCNMGIESNIRELVYYKKDGLEWGTPLEFTVNSKLQPIATNPEFISVFPNPATEGTINIGFTRNFSKVRLLVTDISGLKLAEYTLTGKDNTIDLQHLKKGNYLLRFSTDSMVITKKLVKL